MNQYVTGSIIKKLREKQKMTQAQLAEKLDISDKAVSKWETGNGFPDISILEELAAVLKTSVIELLSGSNVVNTNRSFNMKKTRFYVCPVCGNTVQATGDTVVSCCGIVLPALEAESPDEQHALCIEKSEDEYYITCNHEMSKFHYISFIAAVSDNGIHLIKLYPEGAAECRFKINRTSRIIWYCNRHGLFIQKP